MYSIPQHLLLDWKLMIKVAGTCENFVLNLLPNPVIKEMVREWRYRTARQKPLLQTPLFIIKLHLLSSQKCLTISCLWVCDECGFTLWSWKWWRVIDVLNTEMVFFACHSLLMPSDQNYRTASDHSFYIKSILMYTESYGQLGLIQRESAFCDAKHWYFLRGFGGRDAFFKNWFLFLCFCFFLTATIRSAPPKTQGTACKMWGAQGALTVCKTLTVHSLQQEKGDSNFKKCFLSDSPLRQD